MYHSAISLYSQKFHRPITYQSTPLSLTLHTPYAILKFSYREAMRRRVGSGMVYREPLMVKRGDRRLLKMDSEPGGPNG